MDPPTRRRLAASGRVGHLGTVGAGGAPHVVAICFAIIGDTAYSSVDHKPKRSARLQRLANIQANGRACLLVDGYDEDWTRLWWVRLDGRGRLVDDPTEKAAGLAGLGDKYPQYVERPPSGPVLALDAERWSGWSAS